MRAGMSQEDLAEAVEVSPQSLSGMENSKKFPRIDTVERIAQVTKTPLSWFFREGDLEHGVLSLADLSMTLQSLAVEVQRIQESLEKKEPNVPWAEYHDWARGVILTGSKGKVKPEPNLVDDLARARWEQHQAQAAAGGETSGKVKRDEGGQVGV